MHEVYDGTFTGRLIPGQGLFAEALERGGVRGELAAAVLQSRSPSCGVHEVYDGTFTGRLIPGQGLFAEALERGGVRIVDVADV